MKKNKKAYKVYLWLFILAFVIFNVLCEVYLYTTMGELNFSEQARYEAADNNTARLFVLCVTLFVLLPLARAVYRTSKDENKKIFIFSKIMIAIMSVCIFVCVLKILLSI